MDTFISWLSENGLVIIGMIIAAFTIKGTINFDLNQYLKDRRERQKEHYRALCPHVQIIMEKGKPAIYPTFFSPSGTTAYQCQLCGQISYDRDSLDRQTQFFANNPDELLKRQKKRAKLAKKLY